MSSLKHIEQFMQAINSAHDDKDGRIMLVLGDKGFVDVMMMIRMVMMKLL